MDNFLTFQEFEERADAEQVAIMLKEHGIASIVEKYNPLLDQSIIGKQYNNYVQLRIAPEHFVRAQKVLLDNTEVDMNTVDRHYTLFSLKNEELLDIVAKPNEWGAYNYKLAVEILKERGATITESTASELQQNQIIEQSIQRQLSPIVIFMCYAGTLLAIWAGIKGAMFTLKLAYGLSMLPGILGMIIGWTVIRSRKTLTDGRQIISYNKNSRTHAWLMLFFSFAALLFNMYVLM